MSPEVPAFRRPFPDILQRDADRRVCMEARRGGELLVPSAARFSLFDPTGAAVIDNVVATVIDKIATYDIAAAQLPTTLVLSTLYQERWSLTIDSRLYTPRHEAAVAMFEIYPPVAEVDLILGEYPNLLEDLSDHDETVQPFLDEAFRQLLEALWVVGRWPAQIMSASALRPTLRQHTFYLIFKELFRLTSGSNRWQVLMDQHRADWKAAWGALKTTMDHDHDGFVDGPNRESANRTVHRNVHLNRRSRRSPWW